MAQLPGYTILEQLYAGDSTAVFRAVREDDGTRLILKIPLEQCSSIHHIELLRKEYRMTVLPYGERVISCIGFEQIGSRVGLVLEDFGGITLSKAIKENPPSLRQKIMIALDICEALSQIHAQGVIHKNIHPDNIISTLQFEKIKIIDFGLASEAALEKNHQVKALEGNVAYMSPEQTGKFNRSIDYRSDLYALGVVLYELFAGVRPFEGDILELVHSHIARMPMDLSAVNYVVPSVISSIVMKLLSKNPEERYQTVRGLIHDLYYCLSNLDSREKLDLFKVGLDDVSDLFRIPEKLYCREKELSLLQEILGSGEGKRIDLVLITGYSGIGKSSIIHEYGKRILEEGGRFISGKFCQLERTIPYNAIISALRDLVRIIVSETIDVGLFGKRLLEQLGTNIKIISDLIPELQQLVYDTPELAALDPMEEKNRFLITLRDFLKFLLSGERPLVMFLDDLQWADLSSFDVITYLVTSKELENLHIIGAYRENSLEGNHPLSSFLNDISSRSQPSGTVRNIQLKTLNEACIHEMVSDTLLLPKEKTLELAQYIFGKTEGNPFFTSKLLFTLHEKGIIYFDHDKKHWNYNNKLLQKTVISDSVIGFLLDNMKLLGEEVLEVLKKAACIGSQFELRLLYQLCDKKTDLPQILQLLVKKGFLLPLDTSFRLMEMERSQYLNSGLKIRFKFSHDKIQQAAYSLFNEDERETEHWKTGHILLENQASLDESEDTVFDVCKQLNLARSRIQTKGERFQLLGLNIEAGKMARKNSAYTAAAEYFNIARSLLNSEEWEEYPDIYFEVSLGYVESRFLSGSTDDILPLCDKLISFAEERKDKARVYILKSTLLDNIGAKVGDITDEIRKALLLYDVMLPRDFEINHASLDAEFKQMRAKLSQIDLDKIVEIPLMQEEDNIVIMRLYFQILPSAFQSNLDLYLIIQVRMLELSLNYGICEESCKNFAECGLTLGSIFGDYETGYKFGKAAFMLIEKYGFERQRAPCYFIFSTFLSHWIASYQEGLDYFDLAIRVGMENGDVLHTAYAYAHKINRMLNVGINLDECRNELDKAERFVASNNARMLFIYLDFYYYSIKCFQNPRDQAEENRILENIAESGNNFFRCVFGQINVVISYILGEYKNARQWIEYAAPYLREGIGLYTAVDHCLFEALLLIKENADKLEEEKVSAELDARIKKLEKWSDLCPENFAHKYFFVCAELARAKKESMETVTVWYQKALDAIKPGSFMQFKGLIHEAYAEYWMDKNNNTIAKAYIREARDYYAQWGAQNKVQILEKKYSFWLSEYHQNTEASSAMLSFKPDTFLQSGRLDIMSLLKYSQAISGEIKLESLLTSFMEILLENTGAQNSCMFLVNQDTAQLELKAIKKNTDEKARYVSGPYRDEAYCIKIVQLVQRTHEYVLLGNASIDPLYRQNRYICKNAVKSVLCYPVLHKGLLQGILYLENNLSEHVFSVERVEIISLLSSQISISIENAQLYENLESMVMDRTRQLELLNNELKELSLYDPLTKLYNRRFVYEYVADVSENFKKAKAAVFYNKQKRLQHLENYVMGIFLLDLDHFKRVNDTYGHAFGDRVLVEVTRQLRKLVRDDDFIIRWGGEEILIVLNNSTVDYLKKFSKKVLQTLSDFSIPIDDSRSIKQLCSIGCSYLPLRSNLADLLTLEQTINLCDYALYYAKSHGRAQAVHLDITDNAALLPEELKKYLCSLSNDLKLDSDFISVSTVFPDPGV